MDRQGNTYTILYSIVLVVVVAALLAVVSLSLQPAQTKNKENEKRQNILSAIHITSTPEASATEFEKYIKEQYIVNSKGEEKEGNAFSIDIAGEYAKPVEQRQLPIFVAEVDGSKKYILPVYGTGLWGAIWGYIALNEDKDTVYGTYFSHASETPGLGAEIAGETQTNLRGLAVGGHPRSKRRCQRQPRSGRHLGRNHHLQSGRNHDKKLFDLL